MSIRRILCAFLLSLAAPALAQSGKPSIDLSKLSHEEIAQVQAPGSLLQLAKRYKETGDYEHLSWTLERLTALQPQVSEFRLALATTYAMLGEKPKTYETLLALQRSGHGYDLANNPNFAKVTGNKAWEFIIKGLKDNLAPVGDGAPAFSLPAGDHLFESIAWDPVRKVFLVGSVRDGSILRVDAKGKATPFIKPDAANGLWSVYALAVDPAGETLWVASTSSVYFKGFKQEDYGKAGLFKFSLADGKLLAKYILSDDGKPRSLSSIAAGSDDLVFVADGLRNIIYRVDGSELKPFVANPKLLSLRGMAVSGDGRYLYFADHMLGLFGADLAAGRAFDLQADPAKLALGGIDGLAWYENHLIAVQSGMSPRRVIRISLGADGRSLLDAGVLDAANAAFALPTTGTVSGDGFYFIANSQKNAYDGYGSPKDESKLKPVEIFRSNLRANWDRNKHAQLSQAASVISQSKPGSGRFSNVEGGSNSVSGN